MIALLCLLDLMILAYGTAKKRPGMDALKTGIFALCGFFFLYTVVSAGFFLADCFSFESVLILCGLFGLVLDGLIILKAKKEKGKEASLTEVLSVQASFSWEKNLIPVLVCLCALPFVWNKFELYSMGQDQGTYQVKALYLMERNTHNYITMEEFNKLDTPEEKQKYLDFIYGQNNLYLPRVIEETKTDASEFQQITGTIHGLPTYSALLALWGKIFGYAHMIGVQTILYLCIIFFTVYICENLHFLKRTTVLVGLLTAFTPIHIWLSKSSLTETGISLIIVVFLYFFTLEKQKVQPEFCMLPVIAFAFFHISLFAFMPVFVIVMAIRFLVEHDKRWLTAIGGSAIGYGAGAIWAFCIAPYYSFGNYSELGRVTKGILSEERLIPFILCVSLGITVLCIIFYQEKTGDKLFECIDRLLARKEVMKKVGVSLMRSFLVLSVLFFVYKGVIQGEMTTACEYLQISAYIYMSGLILIPIIYLILFFKPDKLLKNVEEVSLVLLFLYCIVMYSMVMRVRILFYYYYARYAAIFLIVIFVLAALGLERVAKKEWISDCLLGIALLTFVPYDIGFITEKDHSRCEWEFLEDVCEDITEEDAFVAGPEEQQIVFIFPVKALTGCDVYYADENLEKQMEKLAECYRCVYYLDYEGALEEKQEEDADWKESSLKVRKVYTNWNHLSYLDYFNITNPFTPIPLNYVEYRLKLSLHEISLE